MRSPAAGNASPRKSSSTPAMIRSRLDFPAPLAPSTPILAPWKNDSLIPRRISRLGGTTLRRSFITYAYSPATNSSPHPCAAFRPPSSQRDLKRYPFQRADPENREPEHVTFVVHLL